MNPFNFIVDRLKFETYLISIITSCSVPGTGIEQELGNVNFGKLFTWLLAMRGQYKGLLHICVDVMRTFTKEMWIEQAQNIQVF